MRNALIITLFLVACSPSGYKLKTIDGGFFSIQSPESWHLVDSMTTYKPFGKRVLSSKIGRIAVGQHDTINYQLGFYATIPKDYLTIVMNNNTDELYFIKPGLTDSNQNDMETGENVSKVVLPYKVRTMYSYINFNGKEAVLHIPVKKGSGITGIEIDSVLSNSSEEESFILYGRNLSPLSQDELLEAIKTLKFHDPMRRPITSGFPKWQLCDTFQL